MIQKKRWKRDSKSRERQRENAAAKAAKAKGKEAFDYLWDRAQQRFDVHVVSDNGARIRCDYPVARLFVTGKKRSIAWTVETLTKHLSTRIEELNGEYAEKWKLEIKPKEIRRRALSA